MKKRKLPRNPLNLVPAKPSALLLVVPFACVAIISYSLLSQNMEDASYKGLAPVPCVDSTQQVQQLYTFHVTIVMHNQKMFLPASLGHDAGNCLRVIHVNNPNGTVYVQANDTKQYTLQDLFETGGWKFDTMFFMGEQVNKKNMTILVNGKQVYSYEKTILIPDSTIKILVK